MAGTHESSAGSGVLEAVRVARGHARSEDVIDGVKQAIADELLRLDPGVKIEMTEYFNHSYVPDLVASWREDGKSAQRRVFIRGSMRAVMAAGEVPALDDQAPLLLGLEEEKAKTWRRVRQSMAKKSRTLATEITATAQFSTLSPVGGPESGQLTRLVRANIIRGGRGVLDDVDARRIIDVETEAPAEALKVFQEMVSQLFVGATAERLTNTAGLLREFFEDDPDAGALTALEARPLSDSELGIVLPYVLGRAEDVRNAVVWRSLAAMVSLERLESMTEVLSGLDLSPLVRVAASRLQAARSALYFNDCAVSDEEKDESTPVWGARNGRLVADVRRWSVWFGSDARKIRARPDGPDARWDELSAPLERFDIRGIELRGLSRNLSMESSKSETLRQDVANVRESIDDDFHVSSVTVRERDPEDSPEIRVEFGASTATGRASLATHLQAAALLSVKRPISADDLGVLVDET